MKTSLYQWLRDFIGMRAKIPCSRRDESNILLNSFVLSILSLTTLMLVELGRGLSCNSSCRLEVRSAITSVKILMAEYPPIKRLFLSPTTYQFNDRFKIGLSPKASYSSSIVRRINSRFPNIHWPFFARF